MREQRQMAFHSKEPIARARSIRSRGLIAGAAPFLLLFGCAAPGVPITRQPAVPRSITDLSAKQAGNSVLLWFTLPKETVQGHPLSKPPAIEIYRSFGSVGVSGSGQQQREPELVATVPSQMVGQYRENGRVRFPDVLAPADLAAHVGGEALYAVRTRIAKHDSSDSNPVRVQILPAPQPIEDLRAQITETAVQLSWTRPGILPAGAPPPSSFRYRIYRAQGPSANHRPSPVGPNTDGESAQFTLLGESSAPSYGDTSFTFGQAYAYSVRSVASFQSGSVESDESNVLNVMPRDTFAPATPENVAATATSGSGSAPARVDLSWAINRETDLLGYNVYRSDSGNDPGTRANPTPLLTPVYRDNSVVPGKQYFYRITAVDRTGNESPPSRPVAVRVPSAGGSENP